MAIRVRMVWKINNGMAEIITPKPKADAKSIAEKKSINDLVNNKSDEPPVPS
ncbi:hypothetical protein SDC9_212218 [bioreactor metagenome]|uniref:Uncharacterized protein n=1 Tax=bioreactor metagenome TaxID=1076179 RepID=A0A645JLZ4_9ZZZZ